MPMQSLAVTAASRGSTAARTALVAFAPLRPAMRRGAAGIIDASGVPPRPTDPPNAPRWLCVHRARPPRSIPARAILCSNCRATKPCREPFPAGIAGMGEILHFAPLPPIQRSVHARPSPFAPGTPAGNRLRLKSHRQRSNHRSAHPCSAALESKLLSMGSA